MRVKVSMSKPFAQSCFIWRSSKYHDTIKLGAYFYLSVILSDSQKLNYFKIKPLVIIVYKWFKELISLSFCCCNKILWQEKLKGAGEGLFLLTVCGVGHHGRENQGSGSLEQLVVVCLQPEDSNGLMCECSGSPFHFTQARVFHPENGPAHN